MAAGPLGLDLLGGRDGQVKKVLLDLGAANLKDGAVCASPYAQLSSFPLLFSSVVMYLVKSKFKSVKTEVAEVILNAKNKIVLICCR